MVRGGSGKPKRLLGVLPSHVQAVLKPSQGRLVDHFRRARRDSCGPVAIGVSQKVEDDFGVHRMDPRPVDAVLQGEGGGHPLPVGHRARDGLGPRAVRVGGKSDTGGPPAGGVAPGLWEPVVPGGGAGLR